MHRLRSDNAPPPPDELVVPPPPPGDVTVTVTEAVSLPPGPLHASAKLLVLFSGPTDCEPLVAMLPLHAPLAVQLLAFCEDHVNVALPPV
jgi:hypothetical protein